DCSYPDGLGADVVAGQTYYLQVAGDVGTSGGYALDVALEPRPANDAFADAAALAIPGAAARNHRAATTQAGAPATPGGPATRPPPPPPPRPPPPPSDGFAGAGVLDAPNVATGTTSSATLEGGEPRPCGAIGRTVWYRLEPSRGVAITASTGGSNYDTVLA